MQTLSAELIARETAKFLAKRNVTRVAPGYRAYDHIPETGGTARPSYRGVCVTDASGNRAIGGTTSRAAALLA